MSTATPAIRDFARRLVAVEAACDEPPAGPDVASVRVCEKLRVPLAKLAGVAGFRTLMARAVALAKAEVPALAPVQVRDDGSLAGFDGHDRAAGPDGPPGVVVVAYLLGLLVTFIGEPLTRRLVSDAWPTASITAPAAGSGENL